MDNEFGITGKDYTTEFREYNADVGRWWSLDPKPTASESWYVGIGNNPIAKVDPFGDVDKPSKEAWENNIEPGLKATLGDNNPFCYNESSGLVEVSSPINPDNYNNEQWDIVNRQLELINDPRVTETNVVENDEPFTTIGKNGNIDTSPLKDRQNGANGLATRIYDGDNVVGFKVFLSKDPQIKLLLGHGESTLISAIFEKKGIISLHERLGHVNLFITRPNLAYEQNLRQTESFEKAFLKIYQIGTYTWLEAFFSKINPFVESHNAGDPKYTKEEYSKH